MNNNYKRQLQEAYEEGYYQQLNEISFLKHSAKALWRLIRGIAGQADEVVDDIPTPTIVPPPTQHPDVPANNVLDWLQDNAHEEWVQDLLDEIDEIDPYTIDIFHLGPATPDFDMGRGFKQDDVPWNPIRWN